MLDYSTTTISKRHIRAIASVIVATVACLVATLWVSYAVFMWRSDRNQHAFYAWASGPARVRVLTIRKGARVARCTSPAITAAVSTPPAQFDPLIGGAVRFDSASVELSDGRRIECDGGSVDQTTIAFEVEDRALGVRWPPDVPAAQLSELVHFLTDTQGPNSRDF
jgi:hypothetical protein